MTSPSMYEIKGKRFQCAIELAVSIISGRWKPTIICKLFAGKHRYGELKKGKWRSRERQNVRMPEYIGSFTDIAGGAS